MVTRRRGVLWLREPKAPDAHKGVCQWCGQPILFADGAPSGTRQRARHRADRWDNGTQDCNQQFYRAMCWTAREVVQRRGDPCCVDCGSTGPWDADHEIPLWKNGPHAASNIRRRCRECHKAKTAREAAERSAAKQAQKTFGPFTEKRLF